MKIFANKLKESCFSVLPITLIIFIFLIFVVDASVTLELKLLVSAFLLIFGISLFTFGAEESMIELGQGIGSALSKKNKVWLILLSSFLIGFVITFAEPDLMVLAGQVSQQTSISSEWIFICVVSVGVAFSLLLAMLKLLLRWKLSYVLAIGYAIVAILSFFIPGDFLPICFDSGSVTTGPISVPFLIAFGAGVCAVRSSGQDEGGFGIIALCSLGPIISTMILGLFVSSTSVTSDVASMESGVLEAIGGALLLSLKDVALVLAPIVIIFIIFEIFVFKHPKQKVIRMSLGFVCTFVGIVLFITGVSSGFLEAGTVIGDFFAKSPLKWLSVVVGMLLGALAIMAEPALQVLKKQVEDLTNKAIKQKIISITVSLGVSIAVGIAALRAVYDFNILYVLLPIYASCVGLGIYNSNLFTSIAFDCGGVSTGAMAVSFILPFVSGLGSVGGFGTIAFIAIFPVFVVLLLGAVYKIKLTRAEKIYSKANNIDTRIIEFDYKKAYKANTNELKIVEFDIKRRKRNGNKKQDGNS